MKYRKVDLLFDNYISITDTVSIKNPTVEEVAKSDDYGLNVKILTVTTRELFSAVKEVDEYEAKFPTIWSMISDQDGDLILGSIFGTGTGTEAVIKALAYWTGLDEDSFLKLSNGKIINEKANWIIDEGEFKEFCDIVKDITNYVYSKDLVAPKNMSKNQFAIWEKMYKGKMARLRNEKNFRTIADKILILQISTSSYISLSEIKKMSIYHFNKLYEALDQKETYEAQWQIKMSSNFKPSDGVTKHWKEKVKL